MHKGGANEGVFIQVATTAPTDAAIPGAEYTFGVLLAAQALGDLQALQNHQRRVMRLQLAADADIAVLEPLFEAAAGSPVSSKLE